jgi:hypothetical protein
VTTHASWILHICKLACFWKIFFPDGTWAEGRQSSLVRLFTDFCPRHARTEVAAIISPPSKMGCAREPQFAYSLTFIYSFVPMVPIHRRTHKLSSVLPAAFMFGYSLHVTLNF